MNDVRTDIQSEADPTMELDEAVPAIEETAEVDDVVEDGAVEAESDADVDASTDSADEDSEEAEDEEDSEDEEDAEGAVDVQDENPLDTEAEIAADYLEELLDIVDLDGDIDTYLEGGRAHVSIVTESKVLVGPDGEVLDALQELTRLAVMTETGDRSRLMLDIAGYRDQRRQELLTLASDAVQEVKDSGGKVALAPMNPFERKIVHDAIAAAGLTSESEGEEPKRHVVIS